jgi:peptidoglycan-binding protein ArfA
MPYRLYRRPPGAAWLLALLTIPLLLALIGWAGLRTQDVDVDAGVPSVSASATLTAPNGTVPDVDASNATPPEMNFAPLSIAQTDSGFTLGGELPSVEAKTSLAESLRLAFGSGIELTDNVSVKPGVNAPDFATLGSILGAAVDITDFRFELKGDTVTFSGTAPADDSKTEVEAAVKAAWPNMKVVNNIQVK